ncbi:MAG: protein kinase, partial [Gemmatimonadetes bacterium]|nr:protein kinase [Gemmatimonadota bacterium]
MDNEEGLRAALADRYAIEREIGAGGMARVYLARDLKHDRRVAVKVLDPELARSIGPKRFLWEIKTAANLTHPHILPVHDSGESGGYLFYVMPFVEGESLRARLTKETQLPVDDAVRITREVAGALAYAHEEGIVHRDVKPANIMLEAGQAVLADFGVAQAVAEAADERLTRTGASLGTPAYMSPEQAGGHGALDGRSDIYSLGCVLFEMLAGEPPFTGPTPSSVLARHVHERPPSLQVVRPGLPDGLVAAVEKALAKVPADRHQTASEFVQAVERGSVGGLREGREQTGVRPVRWLAVAGLFMVALFGGNRVLEQCDGEGTLGPGPPARIAVTYFDAAGEDPELEALGNNLTEYVRTHLVQLGTMEVVSLNAMRPYKGIELPVSAIEELGIDAFVEGSVMDASDRINVSVQLIDAHDLSHIGGDVVVGDAGGTYAITGDLATRVFRRLREWLGVRMEITALQAGTDSQLAWDQVLQAESCRDDGIQLSASGDTVSAARAFAKADSILEMAEEADPSYIVPIVERGWVASEQASLGASRGRFDPAWVRVGIGHAERALEKEAEHSGALELRGILFEHLASAVNGPGEAGSLLRDAEEDLVKATDLDPGRLRAFDVLIDIYLTQGRYAEAKVLSEKAYEADRFQMGAVGALFQLCSVSLELKLWTDVDRWCGEGRERFPERPSFASARLAALAGPEGPEADPDSA